MSDAEYEVDHDFGNVWTHGSLDAERVDDTESFVDQLDESDDSVTPPSEPALFSVLKNSRRRHILQVMLAERRRVSLADLAVQIAAEENAVPTGAVTSVQRKRVYVSLYQSHLPKLHAVGAVVYNDARKYAHPGPTLDAFAPYLTTDTPRTRWSYWYLSLALFGIVSAVITTFGAGLPAVVERSLLYVLVSGFVVVALCHTYRRL